MSPGYVRQPCNVPLPVVARHLSPLTHRDTVARTIGDLKTVGEGLSGTEVDEVALARRRQSLPSVRTETVTTIQERPGLKGIVRESLAVCGIIVGVVLVVVLSCGHGEQRRGAENDLGEHFEGECRSAEK